MNSNAPTMDSGIFYGYRRENNKIRTYFPEDSLYEAYLPLVLRAISPHFLDGREVEGKDPLKEGVRVKSISIHEELERAPNNKKYNTSSTISIGIPNDPLSAVKTHEYLFRRKGNDSEAPTSLVWVDRKPVVRNGYPNV